MFSPASFYICASGEVRKRANAYRAAHRRLYSALFDIVHSLGANEASIESSMMKLRGIAFLKGAPSGWTKPDKHGLSRPMKTKENAEILRHFTPGGCYSVEMHPELRSFFEWLKCPCGYEYKSGTCEGWTRIGAGFDPVGLFWYTTNGPILLKTPDMAAARKNAADSKQIVTNNVLNWTPPKGCKKVMIEEWKLMQAKHERRAAIASNTTNRQIESTQPVLDGVNEPSAKDTP